MSTEKKLAEARAVYLEDMAARYDASLQGLSPIEQLFASALYAVGYQPSGAFPSQKRFVHLEWWTCHAPHGRCLDVLECGESLVFFQAGIRTKSSRYIIDFVFIDDDLDLKVAVELDGHDFHERTKEQARRDKSRDRDLVEHGWTVLRFTGSEVYADPIACVSAVWRIMGARRAG